MLLPKISDYSLKCACAPDGDVFSLPNLWKLSAAMKLGKKAVGKACG